MSLAANRRRVVYGRRLGPRLRPARRRLLETVLPVLTIDLEAGAGPDLLADLATTRGRAPAELWLEIGFGGGEHLVWQAGARPDVVFIGCEPFVHGVASLLSQIQQHGLTNVRIFPDDARLLLEALPDHCLDRVFILFPDPWPKTRHHKRRVINDDVLTTLLRVMKRGAELRIATDHPDYLRWILIHLSRHPRLVFAAGAARDWRTRPKDWPQTRYEQKARAANRDCTYLRYIAD